MTVGMIFVGLAFWKGKAQSAARQKELQEFKKVKEDLLEAKKEVGALLGSLETVSENVVEEITALVEEYKTIEKEKPENDDSGPPEGPGEPDSISDRTDQPEVTGTGGEVPSQETAGPQGTAKTIMFPRLQVNPARKKTVSPGKSENETELPAKHQMVYALANLGYTVDEIAKQMKTGKGETMLILQLKRKGEEVNAEFN